MAKGKSKHEGVPSILIVLQPGFYRRSLEYYQRWVNALESGRFKQIEGHLMLKNQEHCRYCCLGVLSKLWGRLIETTNIAKNCISGADDHVNSIQFLRENFSDGRQLKASGKFEGAYVVISRNEETLSFKKIGKKAKIRVVRGSFYSQNVNKIMHQMASCAGDTRTYNSLAELNDNGVPFKLIAKVIKHLYRRPR